MNAPLTLTRSDPRQFQITCTACEGAGDYDTQHPLWGSRSCPEAYVNVQCKECLGTGRVDYESAELREVIATIAFDNCEDPDTAADLIMKALEARGLIPRSKS